MDGLKQDIIRFWGYTEDEAERLIRHYDLLGELEDLRTIVNIKEQSVDHLYLL